MGDIGRILISLGVLLVIAGAVFLLAGRIPWLGRLPGDILIERENIKLFIPLGTMLVVSLVLTIIVNIIGRIWR